MPDLDRIRQLVGVSDVLTAVAQNIKDPHGQGALVLGEAGMGKTAFGSALVRQVESEMRVFRLTAAATLSKVPYGSLAPYLTELSVGEIESPVAVLRALAAHFRGGPDDARRALLIVDDAHDIDESSAGVIAQLAAAEAARVVILSRPRPGPPQDIWSMWTDGLLERFELTPLGPEDVHKLCTQVLGSEVLRSTSAVLGRNSGGNPTFLLALIAEGQRRGSLVQRNGVWLLARQTPHGSTRLADLIRNQLRRRTPEEREVLETVALAEPVPLSILQQVNKSEAIDSLEEGNLIAVSHDQEHLVTIPESMVSDVLRNLVPTARSIAIRKRVVSLMDAQPASMQGLLRYVAWALECGARVPDEQLLKCARVANRLFNPDFAERAAAAIASPEYLPAAQVELARTVYLRGNHAKASAMLRDVMKHSADPATLQAAALLGTQLDIQPGGSLEHVRELARSWGDAIERSVANGSEDETSRPVKTGRLGSRLLLVFAEQLEGRFKETEAELEQILNSPDGSDETRTVAVSMLGETYGLTGRAVSAAECTNRAMEIIARSKSNLQHYYEFVLQRHLLALFHSGELDAYAKLVEQYGQQATDNLIYYGGQVNLAEGMLDLRRGKMETALGNIGNAIEALRQSDPDNTLPFALATAAYAASILEKREVVKEYLDSFDSLPASVSKQVRIIAESYAVAARGVLTGATLSIRRLLELADEAAEDGLLSSELDVLFMALRLGESSLAARLAEVAANCEGALPHAVHGFATAVAQKRPEDLLELSAQAEAKGFNLLAAECAGHAVRLLENDGDRATQRAAQQLLKRLLGSLELGTAAALSIPQDSPKLTRRERDIALLAASGAGNKEIAAQLSLSLRTVEGHLYRMFAKLGITRREELIGTALPANTSLPEQRARS